MQKGKYIRPIYYHYLSLLLQDLLAWNISATMFIGLFLLFSKANSPGVGNYQTLADIPLDSIFWAVNTIAVFTWAFENFIFIRIIRKKGVVRALVTRFLIYISSFFIMSMIFSLYQLQREIPGYNLTAWNSFLDVIFSPIAIIIFIVGIFVNAQISYARAVNRFIGFRNVRNALMGRYRVPREEDRIFLFLDLVSSTYVAERLGHKRYSPFLQECYNSFSDLIIKYKAQVYQYVGDEIVLTWKGDDKYNFLRAVDFFYEVTHSLHLSSDHFLNQYGIIPEFNASLNFGNIMVAEVGEIKSEFAYHGDVVNTGARIQKMCGYYKQPLVASSYFIDRFKMVKNSYRVMYLDKPNIKGKQEILEIFAIKE